MTTPGREPTSGSGSGSDGSSRPYALHGDDASAAPRRGMDAERPALPPHAGRRDERAVACAGAHGPHAATSREDRLKAELHARDLIRVGAAHTGHSRSRWFRFEAAFPARRARVPGCPPFHPRHLRDPRLQALLTPWLHSQQPSRQGGHRGHCGRSQPARHGLSSTESAMSTVSTCCPRAGRGGPAQSARTRSVGGGV